MEEQRILCLVSKMFCNSVDKLLVNFSCKRRVSCIWVDHKVCNHGSNFILYVLSSWRKASVILSSNIHADWNFLNFWKINQWSDSLCFRKYIVIIWGVLLESSLLSVLSLMEECLERDILKISTQLKSITRLFAKSVTHYLLICIIPMRSSKCIDFESNKDSPEDSIEQWP